MNDETAKLVHNECGRKYHCVFNKFQNTFCYKTRAEVNRNKILCKQLLCMPKKIIDVLVLVQINDNQIDGLQCFCLGTMHFNKK